MSGGYLGGSGGLDPLAHDPFGLDNSQSYLGVDNVLRDTAISGYDSEQEARARLLASHSRFVGVVRSSLCERGREGGSVNIVM